MKFFDTIPLIRVIRKKKAGDTQAFFVLLGIVSVFLISIFFSWQVQKLMMKKMHWRSSSFVEWGLLQFVPSMYNFSNEIRIQPGDLGRQVNHYPLRGITFNPRMRQILAESGQVFYVTLRSSYRGTEEFSYFQLTSQPPVLILKEAGHE